MNSIVILLENRLLSLAIVLAIGFILLVSLLLNVALRAVVAYAESGVPIPTLLLINRTRIVTATTAALFIAGRYGIAFYLAYLAPAST